MALEIWEDRTDIQGKKFSKKYNLRWSGWSLVTAAVEWDMGRTPQDVPYAEIVNKDRCTPLYNQPLHSHLLWYSPLISTLHQNVVFVYWFHSVTHLTFHKLLHLINPITTRNEELTHKGAIFVSLFHSLLLL